ncbi:MAG TPA: flagellar biosynthetic protein FliO [Anaerovoracaceae bacterium]|nr:flagellar biosynthetic protein FliO [Anaerovoracaceae bacterium]
MNGLIGDVFSMLFALIGTVCIILLTYYASRWYAKKMGPIAGGKHIKVVDRLVVSKTGSILIVDIEGRQYMMGVSDQKVDILMELDETIPLPADHGTGGDGLKSLLGRDGFRSLINGAKKRKGVD